MARKQAANKAQAVRGYLNVHPKATTKEVVAALDRQGIKVMLNHVATIKMIDDAKKEAAMKKPADTLSLEQLKMLAQAIKRTRFPWA